VNKPDIGSSFLDNPANLDLPLLGTQPNVLLAMPATISQAKARGLASLSCSLSFLSHMVIACIALMLTTTPQMPVSIMSLDLMPGFVTESSKPGDDMGETKIFETKDVGVQAEPVSKPVPEPVPEPEPTPPPKPPVEKKPVQPLPEPTLEKVKPISQAAKEAPSKEPVIPKSDPAPAQSFENTASSASKPASNSAPRHSGTSQGKSSTVRKSSGQVGDGGSVLSNFGDADGPRFVRRVMPKYPELARRRGLEGVVLLRLVIGISGELKDVQVVEGAERYFEEAALAAVKASRYAPATKNGQSIECSALLPIRFALRGT
jgi:protein TonB